MKSRWIHGWLAAAILAAMTILPSCGGGGAKVAEQDGAELSALLDRARTAIVSGDLDGFVSLFAPGVQSRAHNAWQRIENIRRRVGGHQLPALIATPQLERASIDKHVSGLIMHTWFDFSSPYAPDVYYCHTTWSFTRHPEDSRWCFDGMEMEDSEGTYDPLISELYLMPESTFTALDMQSVESLNPAPLLTSTLEALAGNDYETLKAHTVGGTLFRALDNGIMMRKVDSSAGNDGKYNRTQTFDLYVDQINNIRQFSQKLRVKPLDLVPFFNAYTIRSMPQNCSKLALIFDFEGPGVPEFSEKLTVSWSAAYVNRRWLIESMYIDEIKYYEYHFQYNPS